MPTLWQNFTLSGSPPCSPQIPILRFGFTARPLVMPMRISSPMPSWSMVWNGSAGRIFFSR